jgi:hypothetical protein
MRLACLAALILVGAFWASSTAAPAAPASDVVTQPPVVAVTTWRAVIAKTLRSPAKGPVIKGHRVGIFMEGGYCLGGPKPEYDHVTLVELPKTETRPFNAAVVTAYIRWPEYSYTPPPEPAYAKCLRMERTIFRRVHTKRPTAGLHIYDGYFSPPHQVWPHVPK